MTRKLIATNQLYAHLVSTQQLSLCNIIKSILRLKYRMKFEFEITFNNNVI